MRPPRGRWDEVGKGSLQNNMPDDYEMTAVVKAKDSQEKIDYSEAAYVDS